jgi:Flp pilus assembly pilin Flp
VRSARRAQDNGRGRKAPPGFIEEGAMGRMLALVNRMSKSDEGQDLMEYALIAALIATGAILMMTTVGSEVNSLLWVPIANAV